MLWLLQTWGMNITMQCLTLNAWSTGRAKPSSAKSDTTSVRQRKVCFDLVREQGKNDLHGQPLRVVQSTPSLKKGSPTRKMSLGKEPEISVGKRAEMSEVKRVWVRDLK